MIDHHHQSINTDIMPKQKHKSKPKDAAVDEPIKPNAAAIPKPLEAAPERLAPFLEMLDPERVYLVHVDRQPVDFKWRIFMGEFC